MYALSELPLLVQCRGVVVHTHYVDVMCTVTCYVGTMTGALLHVVVTGTSSTWDTGAAVLVLLSVSTYAWSKDNSQDEYAGVQTLTAGVCILASVVLVIVSEAMLFISILWSVVLALVAHSST